MKNSFMKRAVELSRIHMRDGHGGPFGAVIVKDNQIISEGWNCVTSINDPTAHAEVTAIRRACEKLNTFDLHGAEIYTSCEPCPMCLSAIYWARISKIYYANSAKDAADIDFDDEFISKELNMPKDKRSIPLIKINDPEAIQVFVEWKNNPNKIKY